MKPQFPFSVRSLAVFQDTLWAACYGKGLFYQEGHLWRPYPRAHRYITHLATGAGSLWYTTWMEGEIERIHDKNAPPKKIPLPRFITPRFAYRTFCIAVHKPWVWIGSMSYLMGLSLEGWEPRMSPESYYEEWKIILPSWVEAIAPMKDGVWAGGAGLWRLTLMVDGSVAFRPIPLPNEIKKGLITALAIEGETLWVGAEDTLWQYQMSSGRWHQVVQVPTRGVEGITVLLPYRGRVYVGVGYMGFGAEREKGAVQGGVGVYEYGQARWRWLKQVQGMAVQSFALFKGSLWVGGYEGIRALPLEGSSFE